MTDTVGANANYDFLVERDDSRNGVATITANNKSAADYYNKNFDEIENRLKGPWVELVALLRSEGFFVCYNGNMFAPIQPPKITDLINHPPHYIAGRRFEPIDVIEDWALGFCLGNVLKYILRAGRKDGAMPLGDLKKARWYLNREIERLEKEAQK